MTKKEIVLEMEATKAAIELVEHMDPDDKEGLTAMRCRMEELCDLLKGREEHPNAESAGHG